MDQILFLFGLYGFGVYFGLLFKRELPCILIGLTGYLWGALFWVIGGMFLQVLRIPYTPFSMTAFFVFMGIVFSILHSRNKTWDLSRRELTILLLIAFGFFLALLLVSYFNLSVVSTDSIIYILTGRRIAYEGLSREVIGALLMRGVYLPQLQAASVFLGDGYLYVAQPGFGFTFAVLFYYISHRIIGHLLSDKRLVVALTLLSSLVLFSTYFIIFQIFYIHNNLISAVYLFLAVSAFWLTTVEGKKSWMVVGVLALLGFSLARVEAPAFALIFLILMISVGQIPYRIRLISILPFLTILFLWYVYLLLGMGDPTRILNLKRSLAIIGSLVASGVLVVFSEHKLIKRFVLPHLPKIMLGFFVLALIYVAYQKPEYMKISVWSSIKNLFEEGGWGIVWIIFPFLIVISMAGPKIVQGELFFYGISSFLFLLLELSYFRNPYRVGWGDSANRMLTHILPIIILYVLMKFAGGLTGKGYLENEADSESRS